MKKTQHILILISSIFLGCEEDPVPELPIVLDFEVRDSNGVLKSSLWDVGDKVFFANTSENAELFTWKFGDGDSSYQKEPVHIYDSPGSYLVTLSVRNSFDRSQVVIKEVEISKRIFSSLFLHDTNLKELPGNLMLFIGETNPESYVYFFPLPTLLPSQLPYGGLVDFGHDIQLKDSEWFFTLVQNNFPLDQFDSNDELIFGANVNPQTTTGTQTGGNSRYFLIEEGQNRDGDLVNDYTIRVGYTLE